MFGAHQNLNGSRDITTPFSGMFTIVILKLGLTAFKLSIKFEVSISTRYEHVKGENWVVWGS